MTHEFAADPKTPQSHYCLCGMPKSWPDHTPPPSRESTNAELLRLLERHHAAWVARERLTPKYAMLYTGSELCRETDAAIERAKEKV